MKMTDIIYDIGEICLYYAIFGPVFQLFGCSGDYLPQAAVFLGTEILCAAVSRRKSLLRFLPLLLIIPALLAWQSIAAALLGAAPSIVLILRTKECSFRFDGNRVHSLFVPSIGIYVVIAFLAIFAGKTTELAQTSLPFYIVWLMCAVLCMRMMRIREQEMSIRYRVINIALLVLVALAGFILGSEPVTSAAAAFLGTLYHNFIAPLLAVLACALAAIPAAVIYGFFKLFSFLGVQNASETEDGIGNILQQTWQETGADQLVTPEWLIRCASLAGIILFLVIVYLLVRKLAARGRENAPSGSFLKRETVENTENKKHRKGLLFAGADDGVRKYYRKYLILCRGIGVPADGSLASDEVMKKAAADTGAEASSELRRLWLPIRYGKKVSSAEDLKKARAALSSIRTEASGKKKGR